jgi:hypothetical protein
MLFIDFPPVLQLQLKRFEYDFVRDAMVKVCTWPLIFILASLWISLFRVLYLYFGAYNLRKVYINVLLRLSFLIC